MGSLNYANPSSFEEMEGQDATPETLKTEAPATQAPVETNETTE